MKKSFSIALLLVFLVYIGISCKPKANNELVASDGNFPLEVSKILINKCAYAGCHNTSNEGNAYLALDSWDHLFQGSSSGAVVIPYCSKYSYLLYTVNTDASLGPITPPYMPFSSNGSVPPLTKAEYMTLSNWIQSGAPDKNGNIPFASDPDTRQKIYLAEQGCDLVSVIDAKSMQIMRYISVGVDSTRTDAPHSLEVSSDGMSVYVAFFASNYMQKIDTRTDQVVGSTNIGTGLPSGQIGSWGIITTSPAVDTGVAVTNWQDYPNGTFDIVLANPFLSEFFFPNSGFHYPHGITSNYAFDTFYIGANYGNCIYKFTRNAFAVFQNPVKKISLDGKSIIEGSSSGGSTPDPHELEMTPDYSRYFVSCQGSNEVRVMDAHADTLIKVIPVGIYPQEMAMSENPATPYIFVVCMQDKTTNPNAGASGSVYVINYNTYDVVAKIYGDFALPHDIAVDDQDGLLFIVSTNSDPNGPPPHHATACLGRAGWYSVYKFGPNSFTPANNYRYQSTVLPYSISARF